MDTSIFMSILSFIGILNQQIFLSRIKFIKLQILGLQSFIRKDLNLIKFINLLLEVPCICALKFLMAVVTQLRVMFGQWESFSIKCFSEGLHIKRPAYKNSSRKLIKNKLSSPKNLKIKTCKHFFSGCSDLNLKRESHGN